MAISSWKNYKHSCPTSLQESATKTVMLRPRPTQLRHQEFRKESRSRHGQHPELSASSSRWSCPLQNGPCLRGLLDNAPDLLHKLWSCSCHFEKANWMMLGVRVDLGWVPIDMYRQTWLGVGVLLLRWTLSPAGEWHVKRSLETFATLGQSFHQHLERHPMGPTLLLVSDGWCFCWHQVHILHGEIAAINGCSSQLQAMTLERCSIVAYQNVKTPFTHWQLPSWRFHTLAPPEPPGRAFFMRSVRCQRRPRSCSK